MPYYLVASDGQYGEEVRMTWLGGNGATEFQIFRRAAWGEDTEWQALGVTSNNWYIDSPLPDYKLFYYRVRSVNSAGESVWSNPDSGFAGGGDAPCIITGEVTSLAGEKLSGVAVSLVGWDGLALQVTNAGGMVFLPNLAEVVINGYNPPDRTGFLGVPVE